MMKRSRKVDMRGPLDELVWGGHGHGAWGREQGKTTLFSLSLFENTMVRYLYSDGMLLY